MQRLLEARSRLETERDIARMLRAYDELVELLEPLRKRALDAVVQGDLDTAERLIAEMERRTVRWLMSRRETERRAILDMVRRAAIRGVQSVELAPLVAARQRASLVQLEAALEQIAAAGGFTIGGTVIGVGYGRIADRVQQAITRRVYRDGLNLSRRLHVRLAERATEFNRMLATGLQEGRGAIQIAKQLQMLDVTDARLPKYIRSLEAVLKGTKQGDLVKELRRAAAEAAKRKKGPLGLGGPARRVVQAARSGVAERLDAAIEDFLQRKVRYHAIVIARTEANNAFRIGHVEKAAEVPYVIGIRWNRSRSSERKHSCLCDEYSTQNWYGLGVGVFPKDELPERPHPSCMCFFTDVVDLDLLGATA